MLSYLGEKSLVDVNTFQLLFHELLTLFLTWLNQINISPDLLAQSIFRYKTPGVNVRQMVKKWIKTNV